MSNRRGMDFDEPPPSTPLRHLKQDPRYDVVKPFEVERAPAAGLKKPSLISSAHGPIRHILLTYPPGAPRFTYEDLLSKLPSHTKITLVAHPDSVAEAEEVANRHAKGDVEVIETPDYLAFSVWAEDACVVAVDSDGDEPATYLVEPFAFPRYGDQVLIDLVADSSEPLRSTQLPLNFQGGNVLIGDEFVLIGRDYLDESLRTAHEHAPLAGFPEQGDTREQEAFVRRVFRESLDPERDFIFLQSSSKNRPPAPVVIAQDNENWLHKFGGWGARQPIFHIDMFVSLVGREQPGGPYRVLVGDPSVADQIMGWDPVEHELQSEFDDVASQLSGLGFDVIRSPLLWLESRRRVDGTVTGPDGATVHVDGVVEWYHATSNNCLVQIDEDRRDVWLPTYGQADQPQYAPVDAQHKEIWQDLGFTVHQLADFHHLARYSGALHCIKKYLAR